MSKIDRGKGKIVSACCGNDQEFDGTAPAFKRALIAVIIINAVMFVVEMAFGAAAASQALKADALDFLADAATYGLSLWAIGRSVETRAQAARFKAWTLVIMGLGILGLALYRAVFSVNPQAELMGGIALLALLANLISVAILLKWRNGDANVRSVWLCSRNDAIGNIAVFVSAGLVFLSGTHWPDVIVAAIMAGLFLSSAVQILRQADRETAPV